ncbi:TIGR04219 family outer membrane beta-barrel protein [Vibrio hepatarius]|jgi:outer membrane protein|uniref:Iron-hydroxamate ABC transporter substrate-binding protein n=1 Tax=Vibrio hepatarius TaxID=171383 RepID=A0A0M0HXI9_9VIBR|nr:TIGR04219 family outer membrane beta-barrel protein [Vibrio hepatarius]KOO06801.1 iron-hydroxamate ABC transporter substrate-binding protein [Vibrio hepatarius]
MGFKTIAILAAAVMSVSAYAESSLTTKFGAEGWWTRTKVNEVNRDRDSTPSFYAGIEHDVKFLPNARVRYSSVDADYMAFDKLDLSLYYRILEHDLMRFDAGVTVSDLSNTYYRNADTQAEVSFDELIWAFYGYAELSVPNTNFDVIGEMNFGDSQGIKNTDLMAGLQYRIDVKERQLLLKGGYRAIDLESDDFKVVGESELGKPFIFAHGWYAGAEYRF